MLTYLYVKTHNETGLKYLGKTTNKNPFKYRGSGKYWINHIKKHGYNVTTEIIKECEDDTELKYWGQYYSDLWNIVKSNEWANLKPECGDGGTSPNSGLHMRLPEHRHRMSGDNNHMRSPEKREWMKENNPMKNSANRNKISEKLRGVPKSEEHKKNMFNPMLDPNISSKRKGLNNPIYDHTIYNFKNLSLNTEVFMTQRNFIETFSLNKGNISSMIHGRIESVKGWIISRDS